jgi:hypothetical protein
VPITTPSIPHPESISKEIGAKNDFNTFRQRNCKKCAPIDRKIMIMARVSQKLTGQSHNKRKTPPTDGHDSFSFPFFCRFNLGNFGKESKMFI